MDLMLDVPLTTQETIMKYKGGFLAYIRNTVFMFGPNNIDDVFFQETYIETRKTGVSVSEESSSKKEGKGKENSKRTNSVIVREEKLP
jgi:hypothetical protein